MAKQTAITHYLPTKVKRKGRHSKKASLTKGSKTYQKPYNSQGK
jgi:hypothetical protein